MKKIIAIYDMNTSDGVKWTADMEYELEENEQDFGIMSDNAGMIYFVNRLKEVVMLGFKEAPHAAD